MLSAFKNFFVTLLIAAALFGVIAYFATQFVTATVSDIMDSEDAALESIMTQEKDPEDDSILPSEGVGTGSPESIKGNSFSFVLVTTGYRPELFDDYMPTVDVLRDKINRFQTAADSFGMLGKNYRSKNATSITLVRVDKARRQVTYTYITPETRVFTSTGYHTLGEVYRYYGYQRVGEYVTSLTGIAVDYTFLLDGYNFDEVIYQLGSVWVNSPRDIYAEGNIHTTRSEYTKVHKNADGSEYVDHFNNSLVLSAGSLEFNQYSSNILNTMKERSSPDIEAKGTYTVGILQGYMAKLTAMDLPVFENAMQELLVMSEKENATTTWLSDGTTRKEPATPVLESNFTLEDVELIYDLFHAAADFSSEVISYPGDYVTATDTVDAYFNPDLKKAIKLFLPYRFPVTAASAETVQ